MELDTKVDRLKCPRCGEITYLEFSYREEVDEEFCGYHLAFRFCFRCGYSGTGNEPLDPEKDSPAGNDISNTFSGLCCLNLRKGHTEYYGISGDSTDEIVSWFTSVLREPDIEPSGSYLNKWDRKAKTILRIGVDQAKRGPEREEQGDEEPL